MQTSCNGSHSYFVSEVVGCESEGAVTLIALCTHCGDIINEKIKVSEKAAPLRLLKEEKRQPQNTKQ